MAKKSFLLLTLLLTMATSIKAENGDYFYVEVNGYDMQFEVISDTEAAVWGGNSYWSTCINTNVSGDVTIPQPVTNPDDGHVYTVTEIKSFAFCACTKITSVTIPEGVKKIKSAAFQNCSSLTSVSLPESLESISSAFTGCALTSVYIPKNVKSIYGSFAMKTLEHIYLDPSNPYFTCIDDVLYQVKDDGEKWIIQYPSCKPGATFTVPDDVTILGDRAFAQTKYLKKCVLPEGLKAIGPNGYNDVFYNSTIEEINLPEGLEIIGSSAFGYSRLKSIDIPAGCVLYSYAFEDCSNLKKVILNDTYEKSKESRIFNRIANDAVLYVPIEYESNFKKNPWKEWFSSTKTFVPINETHFPDENFRAALREYDFGSDDRLMDEEIADIDVLDDLGYRDIQDLTGIEIFTELTDLSFPANQIKRVDLSKNTKLTAISCETNQICGDDMDYFVEHLPTVTSNKGYLYVLDNTNGVTDGNEMTPAQVAVAKNKGWKTVKVYNKEERTWNETAGFWQIRERWFPDAALRHALNEQYFRCGGTVLTKEDAEDWEELELGYETEIQDLTGIELFTGLASLLFSGNKVKRADLSKNKNLTAIDCELNRISGTDMDYFVNHLPQAAGSWKKISVYWGSSQNFVERNEMTPEQVAVAHSKGWKVTVHNDVDDEWGYETNGFWRITEERFPDPVFREYLDGRGRYEYDFRCKGALLVEDTNEIEDEFGLEFKGISDLTGIEYFTKMGSLLASGNNLTTIDLSQNKNLYHLDCYINYIKGAGMDALIASLPKRSISSPGELNVYDDSSSQYPEHNVMTAEQVAAAKAKHWIPYKWDNNIWDWVEFFGNDVATGVDEALPLHDNGQMMTVKDGWYTLDGRKLDSTPISKGVYVRNGKKVVVK